MSAREETSNNHSIQEGFPRRGGHWEKSLEISVLRFVRRMGGSCLLKWKLNPPLIAELKLEIGCR